MPHDDAVEKAADEKYKAERDVSTLTEAAEIRKDTKSFKRAAKMAREQMTALKEVGDG